MEIIDNSTRQGCPRPGTRHQVILSCQAFFEVLYVLLILPSPDAIILHVSKSPQTDKANRRAS